MSMTKIRPGILSKPSNDKYRGGWEKTFIRKNKNTEQFILDDNSKIHIQCNEKLYVIECSNNGLNFEIWKYKECDDYVPYVFLSHENAKKFLKNRIIFDFDDTKYRISEYCSVNAGYFNDSIE